MQLLNGYYFFFLCQQILYKRRSGRPQNNLVPCYSFIFKAHESTNSLVHGWFLIAFSWQWISAWTRQAWCDPCWVKINFFSQWCAGTNPSYLLPSFSHLCMTSWLALPEFHHWLNNSVEYSTQWVSKQWSSIASLHCSVSFLLSCNQLLSEIAAWVMNRAAQSPH